MLDNAIRGVKEVEALQRRIRLVAKMDGDYLFVKVTNPTAPVPASKPPQRQGYGQLILKEIAEKYNGAFQCATDSNTYSAVISITAK